MRQLIPVLTVVLVALILSGRPAPAQGPARGSLVEDRAAKKLIDAGDARFEAEEIAKAVEVWKSVIERYPRSRVRFVAHMRLGNYFLERDRSYDRARTHFEAVAIEENRDDDQRADATLKTGICYYHARNYGKCFQVMRQVIEQFPVSGQVNEAYYYIGLGHFQLAHYSRAIAALEKVGTTLAGSDDQVEKLEAGKRFFIKIEDADLAVLEPNEPIKVKCTTAAGDEELVDCFPVGRNVRLVLGSIQTQLGAVRKGNGALEVRGGDSIVVTYVDQHTADKQLDRKVGRTVPVVGNAVVAITDGAYRETLRGVVLGKSVNVRIQDADGDVSDGADKIAAVLQVWRLKTDEELEAEAAARAAAAATAEGEGAATPADSPADDDQPLDDEEPEIERYKQIDEVKISLTETTALADEARAVTTSAAAPAPGSDAADESSDADATENEPAPVDDGSIHTGLFVTNVTLAKAETPVAGDANLQAQPGDQVRVVYLDEKHRQEGTRQLHVEARCLEGNIGGVRVTKADISDEELRIQTQLKTADALTQIGNRYKEFGLKEKAHEKYKLALEVCEEIAGEARKLGGSYLENTYVQLWKVYYEMDNLALAAAMCQRLQNEFPNSGFVDDALLQLANVARKQSDFQRAIGIYSRLVNMKTSQLRGEAQFFIGECYAEMAGAAEGPSAAQLYDRAFQEYKKVFDQFPDSGRVGEAVAKMANFYYQKQDYARAIDTFETVLTDHPDAKYLDLVLFNYGRCLYRMGRKPQAQQKFNQLIAEFPESPLAANAKKISDALTGSPAAATPK